MTTPATPTPKRWHVDPWPPLAWLETAIKLAALAIGIGAFVKAVSVGGFALPDGARLAQLVVLIVLALGLVAAIFDRIVERELVAMAFVVVNNAGHWGMVAALASGWDAQGALIVFAALMLAGDLVKVAFLWRYDYRTRNAPLAAMIGLTLVYVAGYAILLLLAV